MGIRRLFIAESKGTRKKDSALSSGVLDFCTPNKRLVRKRSRATQSSFPDREKGYENIPFFISGQRHVTRQTNSDKKLPAEQLLFVYFPSRSYLTSREATQSRFLFLFSNGNSFIQRRMKIKSHSRTTFLRFVQGLLLSGKWRKATQSEASKNQSNLSFTGIFIVVNCRCSRRKATRTQRVSSGSSQFQVCPSSFRKPPYHPAFRQNRDCSLQARFFTATHRTQRLPDCASTVYRNRRSIFPKSSNARGTKFADYPNTFYDLPI